MPTRSCTRYAIQQVIREIKKLGGIENSQEARDLQALINGANDYLQNTELLDTQPVPRVTHKQRANGGEQTQRVTQSPPRVPDAPDPTETPPQPEGSPASRTRSKTAHLRVASAAGVRHKKRSKRRTVCLLCLETFFLNSWPILTFSGSVES